MLQVCLLKPDMIYPAARFLMRELLQQLLCCAGKSRCLLPRARLKISHTVDCLNTGIAFLPVQVPEIACAATPLQGSNELTALPFRCCHRNDPKRPLQWYELEALSQHGCIRQQFLLRSSGVEIPESKVRRCTALTLRSESTALLPHRAPVNRCDVLQTDAAGVAASVPGCSYWTACTHLSATISFLFLGVAWCTFGLTDCVCNCMIECHYLTQTFELLVPISWCFHRFVNDSAMLAFNCAC